MNSFRAVNSTWALIVSGALAFSSVAHAEPVRSAAAQTLFDEGRQLLERGRYAEACSKLAESARLEPAAGTLLNLALCREREGRTATAWLTYVDAIALAARDNNEERQKLARERLAALEPKLPRLMLVLPAELPHGFWLELDGVLLEASAWGARLPVDAQEHRVRYGAPGYTEQEQQVVVTAGEAYTLPLRQLEPLPKKVDPIAPTAATGPSGPDTTWLVVGGVGFGLAATGVAATAYFGIRASRSWQERQDLCAARCSPAAAEAGRHARSFAWASNVSAAVAVLGAATGAYAFWLRPNRDQNGNATGPSLQASFSNGHALVDLKGTF